MPQQCSLESAAENMDWLVVTPSTPTVIVKSPVGRPDSPLRRRPMCVEADAMDLAEGSQADEGRESDALACKVCTFAVTGSNFTEQHWYYCYTCGLTQSEGCCSVCVKVCHRGHIVSYSRRSRFFCDCGAGAAPPRRYSDDQVRSDKIRSDQIR